MRYKAALCYSLLCFMLCWVPQTGLSETAPTHAPFSPEKAVEGAHFVEVMPDDAAVAEFTRTLESIAYTSISDGKTMTIPFDKGSNVLSYRTLDLDTLQQSDDVTLHTFGEGETLLRVLPRVGGFDALTNRALYRYDGDLKLIQTKPLPDALIGMEGLEEKLRLSGEINQDGTLILFETEGQGAGIYLCALEPDAEPSLLLPGTTFSDANGNALEGYREGWFVGQDHISAYLWDQEGRIAYELFDLEGRRLYQSFVFNRRTGDAASTDEFHDKIRRHEAEGADGVLLGAPTSLDVILDTFYYFDYQTLQLNRVTSGALGEGGLQFCALDGNICTFAVADWDFEEERRSDVRFFTQDLAAEEVKELPFAIRDVAEFTAALAPGGRILFVCRDFASGVFFRGVFRIPGYGV